MNKVQDQCVAETIAKFMFRHLQPYFNRDIFELVDQESVQKHFRHAEDRPLQAQCAGDDPRATGTTRWCLGIRPYQLGRDWCAQGADVQFWTNEEPPFMNKLVVNHALPMLVDGERAMQWIADRFNGLPTTPNCGQF